MHTEKLQRLKINSAGTQLLCRPAMIASLYCSIQQQHHSKNQLAMEQNTTELCGYTCSDFWLQNLFLLPATLSSWSWQSNKTAPWHNCFSFFDRTNWTITLDSQEEVGYIYTIRRHRKIISAGVLVQCFEKQVSTFTVRLTFLVQELCSSSGYSWSMKNNFTKITKKWAAERNNHTKAYHSLSKTIC